MCDDGGIAVKRVQPVCDREEGRREGGREGGREGIERQRDWINKPVVNYISL